MSDDYTTPHFGRLGPFTDFGAPPDFEERYMTPEELLADLQAIERQAGPPVPQVEVRANPWLGKGSSSFIQPNCWMVSTDVMWALEEGVPIAYAVAACKRAAKRDEWERLMKAFEGRDRRSLGVRDGHPGGGRAARRRGEARIRRARWVSAMLGRGSCPKCWRRLEDDPLIGFMRCRRCSIAISWRQLRELGR
jgi:hypothetical protein